MAGAHALEDARRDDLPESVADLVRVIGLPAVITLVRWHGGTTVLVPREWDPQATRCRALGDLLGDVAAAALVRYAAGSRLTVARCARALERVRNRRIWELYSGGTHSGPELATLYQLTERQVRRIVAVEQQRAAAPRKQVDPRQLAMPW